LAPGSAPVTIAIVNYNSAAFIDDLLASLRDVTDPSWRLLVVDAASADDSLARIEAAWPDATIVRCAENVGFAAGTNIAVERVIEAGGDYVLFLNPDTTVTPGFLRAMRDAADERTIVVPKILYKDDPRLISTHAGGFDWRLGLFRDTYHARVDGPATSVRRDDLETASFACALAPVRAFRDAGMLDERFFMYYEETDWLRRARARGYRIRYEPAALVYHRESGSSGGGWMTPFKLYYATRNRLYLVRKNTESRAAYAAFTVYFWLGRLGAAVKLAARGEWRLLRAMWRGVRDYYLGRMGRTYQVRDL
jgi:GT2 family glycosyltransferase